MDSREAFEAVEHLLLDCPRSRLRIIDEDTGEELDIREIFESDWELNIYIRNTDGHK